MTEQHDGPLFDLPASAADPQGYRDAAVRVAAIRERARPVRERRAAWEAQVNDAVTESLDSVLSQRHSPMLGPLPRQRERADHALVAAVGRWFRDARPTVRVDDYPEWADEAQRVDYVGEPATDPEAFPWDDPSILAVASVLGDGPVAARRAVQNYYLPRKLELSWLDAEALDEHITAADRAAVEAARYVAFDDDRCLRDGQEQK